MEVADDLDQSRSDGKKQMRATGGLVKSGAIRAPSPQHTKKTEGARWGWGKRSDLLGDQSWGGARSGSSRVTCCLWNKQTTAQRFLLQRD